MKKIIMLILLSLGIFFCGCKNQSSSNKIDAVNFSDLKWTYGGVNGSKAVFDRVMLTDFTTSKTGCAYKWATDMSVWGIAYADASALACAFVETSKGWVGGKFEYVSSSRSTREFGNIFANYKGWNLNDVSNPCRIAYVIITKDGRKRSNVVVAQWKR